MVDVFGLPNEIRIKGANNDAFVIRVPVMQSDEVLAVQRNHSPVFLAGKSQYFFIGYRLFCFPGFLNRQHIMPKPAQFLDDRQREGLIRIESSHVLSRFVFTDLLFDVIGMRAVIRPGIRQIFSAEGWETSQEIRLARAQTPRLDQHPDGNPGANDTGFASANVGCAFDAWEGITEILHDPLQYLSLFSTGHGSKELLCLLQGVCIGGSHRP